MDTKSQTDQLITFGINDLLPYVDSLKKDLVLNYDGELNYSLSHLLFMNIILIDKIIEEYQTIYAMPHYSRLLLENHAWMMHILSDETLVEKRAKQFFDSGKNLEKHLNKMHERGVQINDNSKKEVIRNTLRNLYDGMFLGWYDSLSYFTHPSSVLAPGFASLEDQSKLLNLNMCYSTLIFLDTVEQYGSRIEIANDIKRSAKKLEKKLLGLTGVDLERA